MCLSKMGRTKSVIWRWPTAGTMLLLAMCAGPASIALLGIWGQGISCSPHTPWPHRNLVGSQKIIYDSIHRDAWASQSEGIGSSMPRGGCLFNPEGHHHVLVSWRWEMILVRKALLKRQHNCCLPPCLQAKCPLGLQFLAEMVTGAHQSYTTSLMLALLNFYCFLY